MVGIRPDEKNGGAFKEFMTEQNEKRSRLRVDYEAVVTICTREQDALVGQCANVSMDGILVQVDTLLPMDTDCGVKIVLQGPNSTLTIDIVGVVARSEDGYIAVKFLNNLEWWAIFTIYAQYSGNKAMNTSLCCSE